jgi:hypothetical protein
MPIIARNRVNIAHGYQLHPDVTVLAPSQHQRNQRDREVFTFCGAIETSVYFYTGLDATIITSEC